MKISEDFLNVFITDMRFLQLLHEQLEAYKRKGILKDHLNIDIGSPEISPMFRAVKRPAVVTHFNSMSKERFYPIRHSGIACWSIVGGKLTVIEKTELSHYLGVVSDGLGYQVGRFETLCNFVTNLIIMQDLFGLTNLITTFDLQRFCQDYESFLGGPTWDDLIPYGFPTHANMTYVVWKKFLKGYMEHSQAVRYGVVSNYLSKHGWVQYLGESSNMSHHSYLAWFTRWGDNEPVWKSNVIDRQGVTHRIIVHYHELPNRWIAECPANINIPPKVFLHEAYLETLATKRERLLHRHSFLPLTADDFGDWASRIYPITDSVALINEGAMMNHCIGGEDYINAGTSGENIYLRYAPQGADINSKEQTYTITLSCLREVGRYLPPDYFDNEKFLNVEVAEIFSNTPDRLDVDQGIWSHLITETTTVEKATTFTLSEVWGYGNITPDHFIMRDIYQMIYDSQDTLRNLAKRANTFQSTILSN